MRITADTTVCIVPGYGPTRVAALMAVSGVAEKRRVGGLTEQQRERLPSAGRLIAEDQPGDLPIEGEACPRST
ncbi:hypothetical protein [Nonomuraea sp. NPDC049709]|uniref:hypothetical protein n=1 Tax=Nonomuraea sp. NPDC049709 TaxID=3154736 RepID=UPI00342EB0BB